MASNTAALSSAGAAADTSSTGDSTMEINYDVKIARDDLVSISFNVDSYDAGAAHGNDYSEVLNYDLKNGKSLKLHDVIKAGAKYLQTISTYCIKDLKQHSKT